MEMVAEAKAPVIWHLLSNRWNSAITEYALSAARALQACGYKTIFSPLEDSPAAARAVAAGLEVRAFPGFGPGAIARYRHCHRRIRPDMILAYEGPESALVNFCSPGSPTRCIRFRGKEGDRNPRRGPLHRLGMARFEGVLVPSGVLSVPVRSGLSPHQQLLEVALGCDTDRFYPAPGGAIPRPELLILGRLDPVKGHTAFMQHFSRLRSRPDLQDCPPLLRIVGQPANISEESLHRAARSAGLAVNRDYVLNTDRVQDPAGLMSQAAVGVVCSTGSEVICRVTEEFLLCGTPVLVSRAGALAECVFPGAGMVCDGGDAWASEAVARFIHSSQRESGDIRLERSRRARELYSLEAMGRNLQRQLRLP